MSWPLRLVSSAALGASLLAAQAARAAEPATERVELRHDLRLDVPITLPLAGGLVGWTLVKNDVLGRECTWCDGERGEVNALDDFFRTALRRPDPEPARV